MLYFKLRDATPQKLDALGGPVSEFLFLETSIAYRGASETQGAAARSNSGFLAVPHLAVAIKASLSCGNRGKE